MANFASSLLAPGIPASRVVDYAPSREPPFDTIRRDEAEVGAAVLGGLRQAMRQNRGENVNPGRIHVTVDEWPRMISQNWKEL